MLSRDGTAEHALSKTVPLFVVPYFLLLLRSVYEGSVAGQPQHDIPLAQLRLSFQSLPLFVHIDTVAESVGE